MVDKGLSNIQIAGLFSIETLAYTIASFLLNRIKEEDKNFDVLIAIGCVFNYVSMTLTGPAPYFLPDELYLTAIGIFLSGCGGALCNNNCVPALTRIVDGIGNRY